MRINSFSRISGLAVLLLGMSLVSAQAKDKKATQVAKVDVSSSSLTWIGKKVTGQHNGSIKIKDGSIELANGKISGGDINVDMASITVEDLKDAEYNGKLVGHLKSDDFFGTDKNPVANFKIKEVVALAADKAAGNTHEVKGDLTIKGITQPLSFPANITVSNGSVVARAKDIKVDRTLYNVRYGSGKFFQNLGDKTIEDNFLISLNLIAK